MKWFAIVMCIFTVLVFWGAQSAYLNRAQINIGPWKTMMLSGVASCSVVILAGLFGCYYYGNQPTLNARGVMDGLSAGIGGGVGVAAITFAFAFASLGGNNFASAWIAPIIGSLLQVFYVIMSVLILVRPEKGWSSQIFSPLFLCGLIAAVVGSLCMSLGRIK